MTADNIVGVQAERFVLPNLQLVACILNTAYVRRCQAELNVLGFAMEQKREQSDVCVRFQRAIELVGKRWTGAIVRTLIAGPRRYNDLLTRVSGISDRLLSERLRELESGGIVVRDVSPGPPVRVTYGLTCSGYELEPVITALEAWAAKWIAPELTDKA